VLKVEAIQLTAEFINYLDPEPKWPIVVEPFENGLVNVHRYEELYRINAKVDFTKVFKEETEIVELSVRSARTKAQTIKSDLELFPSLSVDKIGFARKAVESALADENYALESIDAEVVSVISCNLWNKKKAFLPLIKEIIILDASEIVEMTAPFLPQVKA
jgi:hypothetical protein